jgi:hypothetical protein
MAATESPCIKLSSEELKWCYRHATNIVDHWGGEKSRGSGTYNHNRVDGNLVGVKGELGLTRWLQGYFEDSKVKSNYKSFSDSSKHGDIGCNGQCIEVKSLRPHHWEEYRDKEPKTLRRMIPPKQLEKYVAAKAIVVWTTATGNIINSLVELKGWNYAHEVKANGRHVRTICDNVWLQRDEDMRDMASLIPVLRGE